MAGQCHQTEHLSQNHSEPTHSAHVGKGVVGVRHSIPAAVADRVAVAVHTKQTVAVAGRQPVVNRPASELAELLLDSGSMQGKPDPFPLHSVAELQLLLLLLGLHTAGTVGPHGYLPRQGGSGSPRRMVVDSVKQPSGDSSPQGWLQGMVP